MKIGLRSTGYKVIVANAIPSYLNPTGPTIAGHDFSFNKTGFDNEPRPVGISSDKGAREFTGRLLP
jgi:hypothetical protein